MTFKEHLILELKQLQKRIKAAPGDLKIVYRAGQLVTLLREQLRISDSEMKQILQVELTPPQLGSQQRGGSLETSGPLPLAQAQRIRNSKLVVEPEEHRIAHAASTPSQSTL